VRSTLWAIWLLVPDPFFKPDPFSRARRSPGDTLWVCHRRSLREEFIQIRRDCTASDKVSQRGRVSVPVLAKVWFWAARSATRSKKWHSQTSKLGQIVLLGGFRQSERPLSSVASIWVGSFCICNNTVKSVPEQCRCGFDQNQHSFEHNQELRQWQKPIVNSPRPTMASVHPAPKVAV